MEVMAIHRTPSLTRERYEQVVRDLTGAEGRAESAEAMEIEGLLVHAAAETEEGFAIFDIFASQEAFDRFSERVGPIARAAGIEEPPRAYPIHTYIASP
jgi:hypothetical protein